MHDKQPHLWSRRDFNKLMLLSPFVIVACGEDKPQSRQNAPVVETHSPTVLDIPLSELLIAEGEHFEEIVVPEFAITRNATERIDTTYLSELFSQLQRENGTRSERALAAIDNTRIIYGTEGGFGSAIKVDESGIYITVRHNMPDSDAPYFTAPPDNEIKFILEPRSGTGHMVVSSLVHKEDDIAIVHAPTGLARQPVSHIQLSSEITDKAQLWLAGFVPSGMNISFALMTGTADKSIVNENTQVSKDLVVVRDMIPAGGTSGGPILDDQGRIVGVESAVYPFFVLANTRDDYEGAAITPIRNAFELASMTHYMLNGDQSRYVQG
ncbi:MAG TPA: serine protease [Patescibacteria group bacterium]|nr:serine protease [Patescibacteria group bacterium]